MWLVAAGLLIGLAWDVSAVAQSGGVVRGTVFAKDDDSRLPGVVISLERSAGVRRYEATTDARGQFEIRDIAPGEYVVRTALTGFGQADLKPVMVPSSPVVDLTLRLPLAALETTVTVDVSPSSPITDANASTTVAPELVDMAPLAGDSFQALLPAIPGVIRRDDGRISLNGDGPGKAACR